MMINTGFVMIALDLIKSNLLITGAVLIVVFLLMYAQAETVSFFDGKEASKAGHLKSNIDNSRKNDPFAGQPDNSHQGKLGLSFDEESECVMCGEMSVLEDGFCEECIQEEIFYAN